MTGGRLRGSAPAVLAGLLLACLLTGCTGSDGTSATGAARPRPAAAPSTYVALGDSYTAGPLVPTTDLAGGCLRSDGNYPSLLARRLDLDLEDVSCSGATTRSLTSPQATYQGVRLPPQLRAVGAGTDLVTLGIGGNDLELFSTFVRTCPALRDRDPGGSPCADTPAARRLLATTDVIGGRVAAALEAVHVAAPRARVLLVGYLRIAPERGGCRALPLAAEDVAFGDALFRALNDSLAAAARRADAEFLDLYDSSEGHDVCSEDPWVNGAVNDDARAAAYHPLAEGMAAVATQLEALLAQDRP